MALWKVETILFTICQTTHTHYSIAARVSELVQNQVTHQFHYFTCYVNARHKKTLKKTWSCPICPMSQTPGIFSVTSFLMPGHIMFLKFTPERETKLLLKGFQVVSSRENLSLPHTHTNTHPPKWNKRENDYRDRLSNICVLANH